MMSKSSGKFPFGDTRFITVDGNEAASYVAYLNAEVIALYPITPSSPMGELADVNRRLWDVEDSLRQCEATGSFGPRFVELARSVYRLNDERSALKRRTNQLLAGTEGEIRLSIL